MQSIGFYCVGRKEKAELSMNNIRILRDELSNIDEFHVQ